MKFDLIQEFAREGPLTLRITGACMGGDVAPGAEVRVRGKRFYWPGDIVAFKRGAGDIASHRMLGYLRTRRGWSVITRADSAARTDHPVPVGHVLGAVTHVNARRYRPGARARIQAAACWVPAALRWSALGMASMLARRAGT